MNRCILPTKARYHNAAVALLVLLAAPALMSLSAAAADYAFTKIADTATDYASIDRWPAVNGSGQVAFSGMKKGTVHSGLFRSDGISTTTIATLPIGTLSFGGDIAMSNAGEVAYFVDSAAGTPSTVSVNKGSGGSVTTITDYTKFQIGAWGPAINDLGTVVFQGTSVTSGRLGIYSGSGGPVATVSQQFTFDNFGLSPAINHSGTVAFSAYRSSTGWGVYTMSSGGLLTKIADTSGPIADFGQGAVTINDAGMVAFTAKMDSGAYAIYRGNGQTLDLIADTTGAYSSLLWDQPVVNNSGDVGFLAIRRDGGYGIYNGPDPVLNKIVENNDVINGQVVTNLDSQGWAFGDNGWATFVGQSQVDGKWITSLYSAHPVPEPSTLSILAAAGLTFAAAAPRRMRRK